MNNKLYVSVFAHTESFFNRQAAQVIVLGCLLWYNESNNRRFVS